MLVGMLNKEYKGHISKTNKIVRAVWNMCYLFFFKPFGTTVFWPWRRCILLLFGAKIDRKAMVYASAKIWAPWNLTMKAGSCLGPNVICYNMANVALNENACVSQYSYLCTAGHDTTLLNNSKNGLITAAIKIDKNAWIGAKAFIGMGVEIGEGAIVGATASVYKDVEPYAVVGGNPAKIIRKRNSGKSI